MRFSPRPASIESVRQFSFEAQTRSYWSATSGELETRRHEFIFNTQFESGDQFRFTNRDEFEMLTRAFRIAPKVSLQPGTYDFRSSEISYSLGPQRNVSGRLSYRFGDFWSGTNSAFGKQRWEHRIISPTVSRTKLLFQRGKTSRGKL
ncbi:MAG: hypothetical protein Ct9H90mP25_6440 [Gammaproteobacteria bacterium]|nr:MAG: hypothetical protein Ct9H90mP25_6440 [Gammaproteobacteria bacterium]